MTRKVPLASSKFRDSLSDFLGGESRNLATSIGQPMFIVTKSLHSHNLQLGIVLHYCVLKYCSALIHIIEAHGVIAHLTPPFPIIYRLSRINNATSNEDAEVSLLKLKDQ